MVANYNAWRMLFGAAFAGTAFATAVLCWENQKRLTMYDTLNHRLDTVTKGLSSQISQLDEVKIALEDEKRLRYAMSHELHVFRSAFRTDLDIVKAAIDSEEDMRKNGEQHLLENLRKIQQSPTQKCKDANVTIECCQAVVWAMTTGINTHPQWYPGLSKKSTFKDFQAYLKKSYYKCQTSLGD